MQRAFAFPRQQGINPVEWRKMRGVVNRLFNARQRQFTVRPQQRQTLQSLRQRQQITFIAVAQQLTGRVIKLQIIQLCARGEPAR